MEAEPECVDNSMRLGPGWFFVPVMFLGCSVLLFICHALCLRMRGHQIQRLRRIGIIPAISSSR
jgi:hypothetical protein